jgi:hypothetical protein
VPKCSICSHPERADIDRALVAGEAYRRIAARTGTSVTSLRRHRDAHLADVIQRAERQHAVKVERAVVEREAGRDAAALDVMGELRTIFSRLNKMLDACDAWLTDAENPDSYDLDPRAHEVRVTYEERDDTGERTVVLRRKATLAELIARVEQGLVNTTVVAVEHKHADPRKLLVETAAQLHRRPELLAKIVGDMPADPSAKIVIVNAIEVVR